MSKESKVDLFDFLRRIDSGAIDYYDRLTAEQQRSLSFFMINRWLSCTSNTQQLTAVNTLVNPFVFKFSAAHKGLLYRLMLVASSGTQKQYRWVPKKKISSVSARRSVIARYYGISTSVAESYVDLFSAADVLDCAMALGDDETTLKRISKEIDQ